MLTQKRLVDMHVEGDLQLMQETLESREYPLMWSLGPDCICRLAGLGNL